jgi:hypothetical protein
MCRVSISKGGFQMPAGAQIIGRKGDVFKMRVSIPSDEDGFLGRECPRCLQIFRIDSDEHEALPVHQTLWCVYCGHHDEHSEFMTRQQRARMMRVVGDLGEQLVKKMLDDTFGRMSRPAPRSGFGIQVTYRTGPSFPRPLPGISEERLVRIRKCAKCSLRYAVFGEYRYCPVCGALPPAVVASDALAAETARLDLLDELTTESAAALREQGVFSRIYVDTLENLVGLSETLASSVFHAAVTDAAQWVRGKGNIFQRLDDTAELFAAAGYADLRAVLGPAAWQRLQEAWAARHVFTHNDGVVDDKYLAKVPASPFHPGQRLLASERSCRQAIIDTDALCTAIFGLPA